MSVNLYFDGGQSTVNGLTAYDLKSGYENIFQSFPLNDTANADDTIAIGIRVFIRHSNGSETEITGGIPVGVATTSNINNTTTITGAVWDFPQTTLSTTDSLVVRVYGRFRLSGNWTTSWTQLGNATFTTGQLGYTVIGPDTWTPNYCVYFYSYASATYLEFYCDNPPNEVSWINMDPPTSWASVGGNAPLYYIPVTLTNSQSSATSANLQVQITINSNTNSSYYASNLANVNWQDGNGNILNSWLESGETNTSTASIYWVNLGSNTIAANGTLTIYQVLYATSVNAMNTSNTGAEPNYTGTYGQYDNGATVFGFYDNFTGTTLNSKWTTSNYSASVNNGLTIHVTSGNNGGIYASYSCSNNTIVEVRAEEISGYRQMLAFALSGTATGPINNSGGSGYDFVYDASGNGGSQISKCPSSGGGVVLTSGTWNPTAGTYYILSGTFGNTSSNNLVWQYNYGNSMLATETSFTSFSYVSLFCYNSAEWIVDWIRCRQTSPNLTAPSVSTGSLSTVATYLTVTDTGSGSDSITSIQHDLSLSDSGSGSDSVSLKANVGLTDTGSGADAVSLTGQMSVSDAGSGSDTISIQVTYPVNVSDAGSGSDALSIQAQISISESGQGSDSLSIQAQIPLTDNCNGSDSIVAAPQLSLSDSGSASDTVSIQGQISVSDSGQGAESLSLQATVPVSDSGSGADSVAVQASLGVTDSGGGSDTVSVTQINPVSVSDSGQGSDAIASIQAQLPVSDTGQGSDAVNIQAQVPLIDSCSGSDSIVAGSQVVVSDSGSGSDAVSVQPKVPVADSSMGSDAVAVQANVSVSDSGSGSDTAQMMNNLQVSDSGQGSDAISSIIETLQIADAGLAVDAAQIQTTLAISDSCHGTDTVSLYLPVAIVTVKVILKSGEQTLVLKSSGS
jgi:hypothetical protein